MESGGERNLRDAVKNARSMFYKNKGKKKKLSRKEMRHNQRVQKKAKQHKFHLNKFNKEPQESLTPVTPQKKKKRKRKRKIQQSDDHDDDVDTYKQESYEAANKRDEKLISSLEKKLKVTKKSNLSSLFKDDGLDYLLEVCEPLTEDRVDSSDEEYLAMKTKQGPRKKVQKTDHDDTKSDAEDIDERLLFEDGIEDENLNSNEEDEDEQIDEDFMNQLEGLENDASGDGNEERNDNDDDDGDEEKLDENFEEPEETYSAKTNVVHTGKYIPPALRRLEKSDDDLEKVRCEQLKKQLKGFLNRVSEATLPGITSEIEILYGKNSRNTMNETLYNLITDSCITSIKMAERFIIEYMVIVASLHKLTGSEVGSYFLQMLVERFCELHQDGPRYGDGKECNNILVMLSALYNFKVVDSLLIYDLIRKLLKNFYEQDIEMILLLLKVCGADIRRDDPGALKDIILEIQAKSVTTELKDQSRIRFMLETINALKNNNMRKIPQYDPTIIEEARKVLKQTLKGKDCCSGVQLKVSLEDLLSAKEKGKWWVIGSAWSGRGPVESEHINKVDDTKIEFNYNTKLLNAAKKQRMNTNIRKNIFCAMMSSEDYVDAFERLLKLNLKEKQAREIIHVLLDCCVQEKTYNPFYAHLADKFCEYSHSNQVTLQYSLWDHFKVISTMKKHSVNSMAFFLAHVVASKSMSLSVLKVVSFGVLDKPSITFFIHFFTILLLQYPENVSKAAFQRISSKQSFSLLRESIKIFLRHFLYPRMKDKDYTNEINMQKEKMKELIEIAESALDGREYVPL